MWKSKDKLEKIFEDEWKNVTFVGHDEAKFELREIMDVVRNKINGRRDNRIYDMFGIDGLYTISGSRPFTTDEIDKMSVHCFDFCSFAAFLLTFSNVLSPSSCMEIFVTKRIVLMKKENEGSFIHPKHVISKHLKSMRRENFIEETIKEMENEITRKKEDKILDSWIASEIGRLEVYNITSNCQIGAGNREDMDLARLLSGLIKLNETDPEIRDSMKALRCNLIYGALVNTESKVMHIATKVSRNINHFEKLDTSRRIFMDFKDIFSENYHKLSKLVKREISPSAPEMLEETNYVNMFPNLKLNE